MVTGHTISFRSVSSASWVAPPISKSHQLQTMVGNSDQLVYQTQWLNVPVTLEGTQFLIDFFSLPTSGAFLVSGVQRLKALGVVLTTVNMQFRWNNRTIYLRGVSDNPMREVSSNQLYVYRPQILLWILSLAHKHIKWFKFSTSTEYPTIILPLLDKYEFHFLDPTSSTTTRSFEHNVHLKLGSRYSVNVRPYRYPYFLRQTIEISVSEMMQSGVVRQSTSVFSSIVLC